MKNKKEQSKAGRAACPYEKKCGGCQYVHLPYKKQLERKQQREQSLFAPFGKVQPIIGMKDPYHYRNKVHGVVAADRKGNGYTGIYEEKSHRIVRVDACLSGQDIIPDRLWWCWSQHPRYFRQKIIL